MDHNNLIETWTTVLVKQFKYLFHEYLECSPLNNYYDDHPHGVTVHENTTSASYLKASNYHYFQPQILVQLRILTVDVSFSLLRTTQTCCGPRLLSFLVQNKKLWLTCLTLSSRGKEMKIIA